MRIYRQIAILLLPFATWLVLPASAQTSGLRDGQSRSPGARINRGDAAGGISPTGRIPNRLQTRIDSRITHDVDTEGNASRRNGLNAFRRAVRNQTDTRTATQFP